MRKNVFMRQILLFLQLPFIMAGCGVADDVPDTSEVTVDTELIEEDNQTEQTEMNENEFVPDIESIYSETAEYPELAAFIIEYYDIPEEYQPETRYYYNYVDLNEDGTKELFAAVVGEYTSGSAGDNVLLLQEQEGAFLLLESFSMVRTPVIISDSMTDGWHDLIFPVYGGGIDPGYVICYYSPGGGYQTEINTYVEELEETFTGNQVLSNNLIDDLDKGNYLTLSPRVDKVEE